MIHIIMPILIAVNILVMVLDNISHYNWWIPMTAGIIGGLWIAIIIKIEKFRIYLRRKNNNKTE